MTWNTIYNEEYVENVVEFKKNMYTVVGGEM